MHLQHSKSIESIRVYKPSAAKRYGLIALCALAYAGSLYACYATAGVPYAKALKEAEALDAKDHAKLAAKAAQHAARAQRLKAQKLATTTEELRDDAAIDAAAADDDKAEKKKTTARAKAEVTLERAAKLAAHTMDSIKKGENKTEEELRVEVFGEDDAEDEEEEEERSLPSKYLPSAAACLFLFVACTLHALFHLMCHWVVPFKASVLYADADAVSNKAWVLIIPQKHKGRPALAPVRSAKVGAGLIVEYQRQLYEYWGPGDDDDDDEYVEEVEVWDDDGSDVEEVVVVDEQDGVVGLGRENGSLRQVAPPLALAVSHYSDAPGLDARAAASANERYGRNVVEVRVPSFVELYKEQLLSPIAMFQVFTSLLWLLDAYWQYVGFTLFSITFMEAGTVMQRQKTLKSLSGMSAKAQPLLCFRQGAWREVSSDDLLPGDLISVARRRAPPADAFPPPPKKETKDQKAQREQRETNIRRAFARQPRIVPCDCVLVRGSAVSNEATLTGESTPQMKDALSTEDPDRALDIQGADRVSVLFSGTELVNATPTSPGAPPSTTGPPPPPDGGAVAYVLRTGFSSSQGELMQMIEFSQQKVGSDTRETLAALGILLVFAVIAATYVFREGLKKGDRTTHELLLRCVIIVTSVVPRQLPMQMALAVNTALMALMKSGIMAIEPYRVPFAGRLKHCLFDKTGTLTTDRLVPAGVVGVDAQPDDAAPRELAEVADAPAAAAVVLAACHALVAEGGDDGAKLVGDEIELKAVSALGWTYDAATATATPPEKKRDSGKKIEGGRKRAPDPFKPKTVRILRRFHFSSALQRMAVVAEVKGADGAATPVSLVKGSPEAVGALLKTPPAWFEPTYVKLAERGLRVLALAYKVLGDASSVEVRGDAESKLELAGLVAFECKTRADSCVVVTALRQSAHRVCMVTGDAPLTALHVARETAIVDADAPPALLLDGDGTRWASPARPPSCDAVPFSVQGVASAAAGGRPLVVTEKALEAAAAAHSADKDDPDAAEDEVWAAVAADCRVFSRMSPQGKARLCRALQRLSPGAPSVLMCGDGGNDVGALKQADVGLALLAGYGDANTTGEGGYADAGARLAAARGAANAEDVLNAQKEALMDAQDAAGQERKARIDATQKKLVAKQREWVEEAVAVREARGESAFMAQMGAVKDVALRLKREMEQEVHKINRTTGNAFDADLTKKPLDPMEQAKALLGGANDDDSKAPMIRPGDASVAAPFTSRAPSIRAVVDLIRQGRCTLLSSLQQQQIMVLESVISAYTLSALSLEGARSSERQMMASGWLLVVASLAFSYATPIESMHPVRPLGSLFHPSICASVAGQGLIHVLCMRHAVKMSKARMGEAAVKAVVAFQRKARAGELAGDTDDDDPLAWFTSMWATPFLPNLLNTCVFLVETSQMVAVLLVNYKGRPWMKGLSENHALFLSLFLSIGGVCLCAWNVRGRSAGTEPAPSRDAFCARS